MAKKKYYIEMQNKQDVSLPRKNRIIRHYNMTIGREACSNYF